MLVEGLRDKCNRAGLKNIRLYIGGQLVIHAEPWETTEQTFLQMGFDRVAIPFQRPRKVLEELNADLGCGGMGNFGLTG